MLNVGEEGNTFKSSDIDLFLYGITDQEQANEKVGKKLPSLTQQIRQIYNTLCANTANSAKIIRTKHAVTIINQYPYRHTQIVLR